MVKLHETRRQVARLSFKDGEVVVTPKDHDIFLISAEKATEACRKAVQLDQRIGRFKGDLLQPLHEWCEARSDRIRACYFHVSGGHIHAFVVTDCPQFDFDLAEEVAALERSLAQSGWRVGVSQLPDVDDKTLATFFNLEEALEVYAKPGSAPQESGK